MFENTRRRTKERYGGLESKGGLEVAFGGVLLDVDGSGRLSVNVAEEGRTEGRDRKEAVWRCVVPVSLPPPRLVNLANIAVVGEKLS